MELKQAFSELQSKVVDSKQKIKLHDLQIENMKRSITHATLTDTEIGQLPQGTKVKREWIVKILEKLFLLLFRFMRVLAGCSSCPILRL